MPVNLKIVAVLCIVQICVVLVHPKTLRLPYQGESDVNSPRHEDEDDDLTRHSLTRLRVDGPAAEVVQQQDRLLQRQRQVQSRQEDDDDESTPRPEIPAIIPGVTKIVNGILTGKINDIFHGAFSFAPKNTTYGINTVYNSIVGLPPPTRSPTTARPSTAASAVTQATATEAEEDEDNDAGSVARFNY